MRKRNLLASCMLVGMLIIGTVPSVTAFAGSLNNKVESTNVVEVASNDVSSFLNEGSVGSEDASVGNFIKNHRGATSEQMNTASQALSPVTNILGYVSGGIVALIMAAIFFITALDLLYIAIPPVRQFLYTPGTDGTGAMTAGRGGYGGYGGYGGMGGMGAQQPAKKPVQLISDEAVQCVALLGGSSTTEGMGAMNRMGGGFGSQPQAQMSKGSVIKTYFIKRAFFMVLLVICIIVLSSSVLLGTGVNLANWGIKLIDAFNKMTVAR